MTAIHVEAKTIHDFVIDPDHADRTDSPIFEDAKRRLHQDGHYTCYICGGTDSLQVHHRACEYMFDKVVDYVKLKAFCEEWDVYGYGRLLAKQPMTSKDDVRNQMVLCQQHHTGVDHENGGTGTGIHFQTFSSWIIQKLAMDGANPVPQKGETGAEALARVSAHERHESEVTSNASTPIG